MDTQEYQAEHIKGAVNIPAYKNPQTAWYDDKKRLVDEFKKLDSKKEIIVYCYSVACMTGRKVGKILAENGIYVKHLNIGWNEWRYDWNSWNHELEWNKTKPEDYISTGSATGKPNLNDTITPCTSGETGC